MDEAALKRLPPNDRLTASDHERGPCVLVSLQDEHAALTMASRLGDRGWRAIRGGLTSDFAPGFRAIVSDDPATLLFGEALWPHALIVAVAPRTIWNQADYEGIGVDWRLRGADPLADPDAWGPLADLPA